MGAIHNLLFSGGRRDPILAAFASSDGGYYLPSPSTCFQDTGATTPCISGDPVGYLQDLSGKGRHLLQGTSTLRPTLNQDGDGYWYLQFDGVDDLMESATASLAIVAPSLLICCVSKDNESSLGFMAMTATSTVYRRLSNNLSSSRASGNIRDAVNGNFTAASASTFFPITTKYIVHSKQEAETLTVEKNLSYSVSAAATGFTTGYSIANLAKVSIGTGFTAAAAAGKYYGAIALSGYTGGNNTAIITRLAQLTGVSV